MARPKKEIDAGEVTRFAELMAPLEDIAYVLGCSTDTLQRRFAGDIAKGRATARMRLRAAQWKAALNGRDAMMIFLGKNYLGQSDRPVPEDGDEAQQPIHINLNYKLD